jgi:hypothetical protein
MKKADKKLFTRLAKASARRQVLLALANDHKSGDVTARPRFENSLYMKQSVDKCFKPAYRVVLTNWKHQNRREKSFFKSLCLRSAESIEKANMDLEAVLEEKAQ